MGEIVSFPLIHSLDFAVYETGDDIKYVTLRDLTFENVTVPKGFVFDGVTVKAPFTALFSNKDLRNGIKASCFHDFMCKNKDKFGRREASSILFKLWKNDGLPSWKAAVAYCFVETFQVLKGWR